MNLFRKHAIENEKRAIEALKASAEKVIAKYIATSEILNSSLMSDQNGCIMCNIDKATKWMARLHQQAGEIAKTYELLTGKKLDLDAITDEAVAKHYPLLYEADSKGNYSRGSKSSSEGSSEPLDEKGLKEAILSAVAKVTGVSPSDIGVRSININPKAFKGLNPSDFDSFGDYMDAVRDASDKFDNHDGKSVEEVLTNSAIETAEEIAKTPKSRTKQPKTDA